MGISIMLTRLSYKNKRLYISWHEIDRQMQYRLQPHQSELKVWEKWNGETALEEFNLDSVNHTLLDQIREDNKYADKTVTR